MECAGFPGSNVAFEASTRASPTGARSTPRVRFARGDSCVTSSISRSKTHCSRNPNPGAAVSVCVSVRDFSGAT